MTVTTRSAIFRVLVAALVFILAVPPPMVSTAGIHHEETIGVLRRAVRQVSLDDLIHGALQLVKPIFDPSQPLNDPDPTKVRQAAAIGDTRQQAALGVEEDAPVISNSPICRGNSRICKFVACSAHNFKHDSSFANLNLAAQLLADKQMRKTIANNPDAVVSVCREQGLSESQCGIFLQGFQMIDRFLSAVDREGPTESATVSTVRADDEHVVVPGPLMDDDSNVRRSGPPLSTVRGIGRNPPAPALGSRTWSTHVNAIFAPGSDDAGRLAAMAPPARPPAKTNHVTTKQKAYYDPADGPGKKNIVTGQQAPPFAVVPQGSGSLSEKEKALPRPGGFNPNEDSDLLTIHPDLHESIRRLKRAAAEEDYYDQVHGDGDEDRGMGALASRPSSGSSSSGSKAGGGGATGGDDYYDQVESTATQTPGGAPRRGGGSPSAPLSPLIDCFSHLG